MDLILVSPELSVMLSALTGFHRQIADLMQKKLLLEQQRFRRIAQSKVLHDPLVTVEYRRMKLDMLSAHLKAAYQTALSAEQQRLAGTAAKLDALSPLKVLSRGYAIAEHDGKIIRSVHDTDVQDAVTVIVPDGRIHCIVTDCKEK